MRIYILSIDDDDGDDDRGRKRKTPKARLSFPTNTNRHATRTEERWMDGVDLKPHEIAHYWARFNRATATNGLLRPDPRGNFA